MAWISLYGNVQGTVWHGFLCMAMFIEHCSRCSMAELTTWAAAPASVTKVYLDLHGRVPPNPNYLFLDKHKLYWWCLSR